MPVTSLLDVRTELATALSGVAASVYPVAPTAVIPPACVIIPDSPWLESTLLNGSVTKVKVNFIVTAAVANNTNSGALDQLEALIISILGAMPAGYVVGDVQRPSIVSVGASDLLVADLNVSTYFTQENN